MIYINDWCLNDYVDTVDEKLFFHGETPEIMYEDVTIPGRSGKLHLDLHRFEERTIEISCWMRSDFRNRYRVLLNKLNALKGVVTLRCTPAPEMWGEGYYNTVFKGKISAPTMGSYLKNGSFTLKFNADPRYWLDVGMIDEKYLALDHYSGNHRWQAALYCQVPARIYDLSTTVVADSFANMLEFVCESTYYERSDLTIQTDSRGAYIDLAQILPTSGDMSAAITFRFNDDGNDLNYMVTTKDPYFQSTLGQVNYYIRNSVPIINHTGQTAKPLMVFHIDWRGTQNQGVQVGVNNIYVRMDTVTADFSGDVYIDSEIQDCYYYDSNGEKQNANSMVSITYGQPYAEGTVDTTDFPVLVAGENTVVTGRVTANPSNTEGAWIKFLPRWYLI